jgi:5-methylcytosine-specific restriction enzyme subunit McrC
VKSASLRKPIQRYEYGHLLIGEEGFTKGHWEAFVKLNTIHEGKYFEVLHNGVRFKQYVGVIQVDDILVEILPKNTSSSPKNNPSSSTTCLVG